MSLLTRWPPTLALLLAVAFVFSSAPGILGHSNRVYAAEGNAFPDTVTIDVFKIASSRTLFLPDPPAGKVTVQLLATAVKGTVPGEFKFYLAPPEMSEVFHTVSEPEGRTVPTGQELENGVAFVEPGSMYTVQVVYKNPTDRDVDFLVIPPLIDPSVAVPYARALCWCAAIPFVAPAHGTFSRIMKIGVGPTTPVGAKVIVQWPVIALDDRAKAIVEWPVITLDDRDD
ncbi:MAG: hypothetical protein O7G83_03770 [Proteobacteria bacterium]|nr:hypothetical protein [Pseudomonadota bacterium]